jgi:hypothetical protein
MDFVLSARARLIKTRLISSTCGSRRNKFVIFVGLRLAVGPMKLDVAHEIELLWCSDMGCSRGGARTVVYVVRYAWVIQMLFV